jgi:HK97 family phage major capsid protein
MDEKNLRDGIDYVKSVLRTMHESAEERSFDLDEQAAWDAGVEFVRTGEAEVTALEERKSAIAEFAPVATETGDGAMSSINVNTHTVRDAFDHESLTTDKGSELRSRALDVIEKHLPSYVDDSAREAATRLVESRRSDADAVARHIVRTSSPEYLRAFEEYVENPQAGMPRILTKGEARTAMSLTAANGGVLVPQFLDPTIVLTNAGSSNQVREIANVTSITTDQWDGVTSAGVSAEWLAEGREGYTFFPKAHAPRQIKWIYGIRSQAAAKCLVKHVADTFPNQMELLLMWLIHFQLKWNCHSCG